MRRKPGITTFIGIDLAWQGDKNHSGGAILRDTHEGLELLGIAHGMKRLDDVLR
jgi:predicted RNase H-like nuclease